MKTLKTHRISEENRGLLIDWLVQVFRVLGQSHDQTFFISVSLIDRYLKQAMLNGCEIVQISQLQPIALAAVLISTKYEDTKQISLQEIYELAGHQQFSKDLIIQRERDILQTLHFQVREPGKATIFQTSLEILKLAQSHNLIKESLPSADQSINLDSIFKTQLVPKCERYLLFLCYLTQTSGILASPDLSQNLAPALASLALKVLKRLMLRAIRYLGTKQQDNK